jgi:phosphohistidine phosphatase SixA
MPKLRTLHQWLLSLAVLSIASAAAVYVLQQRAAAANERIKLFSCLRQPTLPHLQGAAEADALWNALRAGGQVVLLRHALTTPGTGDPPAFKLGDCSTQRNLSNEGRAQAARIGETFEQRGATVGLVLSSQYCRCVDTAKLAFGTVREEPALNSIFKEAQQRDAQVAAMNKLLSAAPEAGAGNTILVTHQVNITALTELVPAMGEAVIVAPGGQDGFNVVGLLKIVE